jgi:hypothetical protein
MYWWSQAMMFHTILLFLLPPLVGAIGGGLIFLILNSLLAPSWQQHSQHSEHKHNVAA